MTLPVVIVGLEVDDESGNRTENWREGGRERERERERGKEREREREREGERLQGLANRVQQWWLTVPGFKEARNIVNKLHLRMVCYKSPVQVDTDLGDRKSASVAVKVR